MSKFLCVLLVVAVAAVAVNAASAEKNKAAGEKYLAEHKNAEGVITTESGLQYKVVRRGSGKAHPSKSDTVSVHYRGTTIDGKEFDSSYSRGQPASFGVSQVIKGWTEALQLMSVGDEYELTIPSNLAYGTRGAGASIGPNSVLIFKVELLNINGKTEL